MKNKVLFILLSFSLCFPLIAVSQNTHRENGWYHVIDNKKDSLSIEPILTVNDFATLELDTSNLGQYAIFGQISQQKIKKWAIETEKAIGKQIAFVFNDSIITSPQVNAKIESGAFVITSSSDKKLPQLYKQIIENKLYSCGITYRCRTYEITFLHFLKCYNLVYASDKFLHFLCWAFVLRWVYSVFLEVVQR